MPPLPDPPPTEDLEPDTSVSGFFLMPRQYPDADVFGCISTNALPVPGHSRVRLHLNARPISDL